MKYKLLTLAFTMLLTQSAFAIGTQNEPPACPSLSAIKSVGIHKVEKFGRAWFGYNTDPDQYDTKVKWTFYVEFLGDFKNENEALIGANASLNLLTTVHGPEAMRENHWGCVYGETNNHNLPIAFAVTPPSSSDFMSALSKYKR
jgi:hypothetical protein